MLQGALTRKVSERVLIAPRGWVRAVTHHAAVVPLIVQTGDLLWRKCHQSIHRSIVLVGIVRIRRVDGRRVFEMPIVAVFMDLFAINPSDLAG
jgi:hypothetical protein